MNVTQDPSASQQSARPKNPSAAADPRTAADGRPLDLTAELTKAKAAASLWAATQFQLIFASVRNLVLKLAVLAVLGFIGLIVLIYATVQFMHGLAMLISSLSDLPWLGPLVIGGMVLIGTLAVLWIVPKLIRSAAARSVLEQYGAPPTPESTEATR